MRISRTSRRSSSIFQAMTFRDVVEWDGAFLATAATFERALSQIKVFEVFEVRKDTFLNVECFGARRSPGQLLQAFFDGLRKSLTANIRILLHRSSTDSDSAVVAIRPAAGGQ